MRALPLRPPPEPFFLGAPDGERFCLFHPSAGKPRGAVLYVHPFAEEMNKSRRMAALQSRSLAAHGHAVLQIDLFGCGDSSGDFADATWERWRSDVALGMQWLRDHVGGALTLWGLRLGGLLALHAAHDRKPPDAFVLWQPILSGATLMAQFLRLRIAGHMLSETRSENGMQDLRSMLDSGETVEIAGYPLTRGLLVAIEAAALGQLAPTGVPVHWFEVVAQDGRPQPPASARVVDEWVRGGASVDVRCVTGPSFWNTLEITECPALIEVTTAALLEGAR